MIKHKIISKYGVMKYFIKSKKGQQLDEMAVQKLRNREVPGLLTVEVNRRKNSFQLIYDVTGFTGFETFLLQPMTKDTFIHIVRNIVSVFTAVQEQHLEVSKINCDRDSIFVNPSTNNLFYIYVPIRECDNGITLRDLLLTIPPHCVFSAAEDTAYISQFLQFISERPNISKVELSALLNSMENNVNQFVEPEQESCPYCGRLIEMPSVFCTGCGKKLEVSHQRNSNTYDPFKDLDQPLERRGMTGQSSYITPNKENRFENYENYKDYSNRTTVLGKSPGMTGGIAGTTVLGRQNLPYLIRKHTGERITIDCSPFRIGKERMQCHYYVSDNSAVSRNHADIWSEEGRFYIQDNGSTNDTYINGRRIEQHRKCEITNDTQLRLANEDFTFYINEGGTI